MTRPHPFSAAAKEKARRVAFGATTPGPALMENVPHLRKEANLRLQAMLFESTVRSPGGDEANPTERVAHRPRQAAQARRPADAKEGPYLRRIPSACEQRSFVEVERADSKARTSRSAAPARPVDLLPRKAGPLRRWRRPGTRPRSPAALNAWGILPVPAQQKK
jgi:hypothetical protein